MSSRWSPHPRYRLYTSASSYSVPLRQFFSGRRHSAGLPAQLEAAIRSRFGVNAAVCVPMARTGLYLGLKEMIRPGQAVVMSPLTIVDVVNMVLLAGGVPVFADIHRQSCSLDPDEAESLIDGRTGAVLISHLHGEGANAHVFRDLCRRRGVPLIEDAAQAFGAVENGCRLGTIGDLGIYSFGFYKNVNTWRGGMLVSHDAGLIDRVRNRLSRETLLPGWGLLLLSLHGLLTEIGTWPPFFASIVYPLVRHSLVHGIQPVNRWLDPEAGATRISSLPRDYMYRMTAAQASLALARLDRVDADTNCRITHAAAYHRGLAGLTGLIIPEWKGGQSNIYTYYPVQCQDRDALLRYAMIHNRDFAAQHLRNCADMPDFGEYHRDCPNARAASRELVLLPTYPRYPAEEVVRNIHVIRDFFRQTALTCRE
ncbi:MAG TPA: DegT/DnrJ/EryC1/StrS family aminotransferase [Acidobacteriota bacterium]|nr:DegT/DnrJ/EryC1/StrS family aminotransferase [Acidobacteriota bacterium]